MENGNGNVKILIAAGGTGGHIYPGIAISEELKRTFDDPQILFVGSHVGMEKDIVPKAGYNLKLIRARGFEKGFSLETLAAVKGIFDSLYDSYRLLREEKPDLVIGTGGFTSAMFLVCSSLLKIPVMIHEQNAYPGRSNRLAARFADRIGISFSEAEEYFPKEKVFLAGNPVRDAFKHLDREGSRKRLGLESDDKLVIFMGGSQGAQAVNESFLYVLENYSNPHVIYYLLAGESQAEAVNRTIREKGLESKRVNVYAYYNDMSTLLAAGDLIISRSGAMSITEIAASGLPSILIPFPNAAGDHQTFNAKVLSESGGAVLIPESELTGEKLKIAIKSVLEDPERLKIMRERTEKKKILDADQRFCREAAQLVKKTQKKSAQKVKTEKERV